MDQECSIVRGERAGQRNLDEPERLDPLQLKTCRSQHLERLWPAQHHPRPSSLLRRVLLSQIPDDGRALDLREDILVVKQNVSVPDIAEPRLDPLPVLRIRDRPVPISASLVRLEAQDCHIVHTPARTVEQERALAPARFQHSYIVRGHALEKRLGPIPDNLQDPVLTQIEQHRAGPGVLPRAGALTGGDRLTGGGHRVHHIVVGIPAGPGALDRRSASGQLRDLPLRRFQDLPVDLASRQLTAQTDVRERTDVQQHPGDQLRDPLHLRPPHPALADPRRTQSDARAERSALVPGNGVLVRH